MRNLKIQIIALLIVTVTILSNIKVANSQMIWTYDWYVGLSWGQPGDLAKEKFGFPPNSSRNIYGLLMDLSIGLNFNHFNISPRLLVDGSAFTNSEFSEHSITFRREAAMVALNTNYRIIKLHEYRFYAVMNYYYLHASFDSLQGDQLSYSGHISGVTMGGRVIFPLRNKYKPEIRMKAFDQIFFEVLYNQALGHDLFKEIHLALAVSLSNVNEKSGCVPLLELGYRKIANDNLYKADYLIIGLRIIKI